jgi:hypothetical protein
MTQSNQEKIRIARMRLATVRGSIAWHVDMARCLKDIGLEKEYIAEGVMIREATQEMMNLIKFISYANKETA